MPYPIVQITTVLKPGLTEFNEVLVKLDRPTKPGSTLVVQVVGDGYISAGHNTQGLADLGPKSLSDNKFNKYTNLQIQDSGVCQNNTWYCINAKEKTRNIAIKFKSNVFGDGGTLALSFAAVTVVELYSHVKKYDSWYPVSAYALNATDITLGPLNCTGYDVLLAIATFQSSPHTYNNLAALGLDAIDQILNQVAPLSVAVWHGASGGPGSVSMDISWGGIVSRASLVGLAFKTDDPNIIVFPDPTPIVGNLQNPDGTGANGVLMLALNRPAVTHLGQSVSTAAVLIPFVDGSIVGSFSVYGNDLLKGETCYRAIFYDLQGNALLNTCIDISTDVSFDVASITV